MSSARSVLSSVPMVFASSCSSRTHFVPRAVWSSGEHQPEQVQLTFTLELLELLDQALVENLLRDTLIALGPA